MSLHKSGVGVLVKWIGIGRKLVHECQGVGLCYDGGEIGENAGESGDSWECEAEFVEDIRGSAEDVTWER